MMTERNSFILYASYEQQLDMLTDEQAGQLMRGIYVYARTGEQCSTDSMVAMLLSVICHQMDLDGRRYEETKERRREAGRKGGLQRAENREKTKNTKKSGKLSKASNADEAAEAAGLQGVTQQAESDAASKAKQCLANLAVDDDVDVYVDEDEDVDVVTILSGDGDDGGDEEEEYAGACELIYYTDNGYPTTQSELNKLSIFTDKLFRSYWNREPSQYDMAQVFDHVQGYGRLPDGTGYGVFDAEKGELLVHVFKLAANNDSTNWNYVRGVYKRFREREIHTLYDAELYDWNLSHGRGVLV